MTVGGDGENWRDMITHYDLFAGIGGFSLALDEVFYDEEIKHIFSEWEEFPTAVLKKHWPNGTFYGDITELIADTDGTRRERSGLLQQRGLSNRRSSETVIVTGGFPCQPFSHAGRRKGTADDRYQWPNMFEVIRNIKPNWVIAENVRGLVTWNEGMVLEQVCTDLENEGYEVQPIIIPAAGINAPHRRDRIWIIAHANGEQRAPRLGEIQKAHGKVPERHDNAEPSDTGAAIASDTRRSERKSGFSQDLQPEIKEAARAQREYPDWGRDWREVAFTTCNDGVDDGFPRVMDGTTISRAKWRRESLKAYGNAIVPEVAIQIFQAIREAEYAG